MGWFDEQITYRRKREDELLNDSFQRISKSVSGHKIGSGMFEEEQGTKDALSQLLQFFDVKEKEIPAKLKDLDDKLDYLLASSGIMYRTIRLDGAWYKDAAGAMLASLKEDGTVITILPGTLGGLVYVDPHTGQKKKIDRKEAEKIADDAYGFYRSFPMRKLKLYDLWKFMFGCLNLWDLGTYCLSALVITLVGMLIPKLNKILTGEVLASKSNQLLIAIMVFMFCVTVSNLIFGIIREILLTRIGTKLTLNVNSASMMRLLALPTGFFKNYTAGELSKYMGYMNSVCNTMVSAVLTSGITGLFSLIYLFQIFAFARSLVLPSLIVTILTLAISMSTAALSTVISKEQMKLAAEENGLLFSLLSGIQKIRLAGAEKRAFVKWANVYAKKAEYLYNPPTLLKLSGVFTSIISMCGTIVIYYIAVINHVTSSEYFAFNASYAYISGAFAALASMATTIATIRPSLELIRPLMEAEPEAQEGLESVVKLSGSIEMSHVSFRYDENGPWILDDLSINIPARQYVAIVGQTGCGKSTLMKLLLGFEKPQNGSIFYDRKDTGKLDMRSVRRKIGTVMQDGKLFQGSIYENIAISAPGLTMEEAWEAAETAGIADDIRNMPMGMHTMISENAGGISGGQKQRLMIARAVAPKPKVLFLDEATSALDNMTQKHVSEAMDNLRCTRIVIAHRLSTIRHCDRILVLDHGKIIEDGTYDKLIEQNGVFAELVARQRI